MANLLDLSPDEFMFTLQEFGYSPDRRDELIRQYREHNSVFGALNRAAQERQAEIAGEGRRPVAGGFLSKPEGSLGMDAVRGLRVEPMAGLLGMLTGAGRAVEAPAAAYQGLIPMDDMALEALGTAGMASVGGAAMTRPAGSVGMGGRVADDGLPEPRNAAERMARDILDMRAAGRAGEVTDAMMAQADPQYMFANTPLPMDDASRMVRAAGQGFDLMRPMYHGTDTDFASVKTDMGSGERYKTGFFSSDNPDVAASYAPNRDLGRILPVMSRAADRGVVVDAQGANWNRIDAASPARDSSSVLSNEFPELAGDQNAYSYFSRMYDDLMGLRELSTNAMARERRFEGDPSITFENVIDRGPFSLTNDQAISASQPSTVAVDFYPQNVRSRFARFDPEFAHLANLNAANIDPLAGLFGALAAEEQRRQRNSQ